MTAPTTPLTPGVWGILATPFHGPDLTVDVRSLERQVGFYRDLDVAGVVALGVFGEATKLDSAEQRKVVEVTAATAGALPIVVGLSARAAAPALEQARVAAAVPNLAGLMVQVNSADAATASGQFAAIHAATGAGVVIQDYPTSSGVHIGAEALAEVVQACPFAVAVKAEAPPTSTAIADLAPTTDVPIFGGLGGIGLLDELAAGAAGAMTGFSHPEALLATVDAFQRDGFSAGRDAFAPWLPLANFEGQQGIGLGIRKEILRRRGIIADAPIRAPGRPFPGSLGPLLDHHLASIPTGHRDPMVEP
jgi:4-hydroxy-tetrahydrodipicolinate synthase